MPLEDGSSNEMMSRLGEGLPQLVALARQYFLKDDRMAGTPTPS